MRKDTWLYIVRGLAFLALLALPVSLLIGGGGCGALDNIVNPDDDDDDNLHDEIEDELDDIFDDDDN